MTELPPCNRQEVEKAICQEDAISIIVQITEIMSSFISYLTRNEIEPKRPTFRSFLEEDEDENDEEVKKKASSFFQADLFPRLLPGERIVTEADSVLCFAPFTDKKQGISGKLFITNFKITFITADRSSYEGPAKRQRNKLIDDCDIPLTSVASIYQVIPGGRRRKLNPGSTVSTLTKYLEIYGKDFRVHVFWFKFTPDDQIRQTTNAVVHHAYPTKSYLLFAFDYGQKVPSTENGRNIAVPMFESPSDWEQELRMCGCTKWWVTDVNLKFSVSTSLPEHFVVPCGLMNDNLQKAAQQCVEGRLPTWSYTHTNGASLIRMSEMNQDSVMAEETRDKLLSAIQLADINKGPPIVVDLAKECPSNKDLQQSHDKLRELCSIDKSRDFLVQDSTFMSTLEGTKWLSIVAQCLTVCNDVVNKLTDNHTVVIQENSSRHYCPVVSCLVQIMVEQRFRTQIGFQSLIQREWVAMGHPFQKHFCLIQEGNSEQVPLFLLFLDCVWQLLQQFPSSFAFSETYLVTLWDSTHVGLFDTFLFDSCYQQSRFHKDGRCMKRFRLPPVWDWNIQFSQEEQSFFNNPLYIMKTNPQFKSPVLGGGSTSSSVDDLYALKLGNIYETDNDKLSIRTVGNRTSVRLTPCTSAPVIKLWSQCYLRWQTPAQIVGGGNPSEYLQQCLMVEEIICMQHKLESMQLDSDKKTSSLSRPKSDLVFSIAVDTPKSPEVLKSTFLTSSFPFSPGPTTKDQSRMIFTPISSYLENSIVDYDYTNSED